MNASFDEVLALGDDALIAAQRLAEWCARAPDIEEDIALANLALDQLGTARLLLSYAGELEGAGRDEDALAYLRDDHEFRNVLLVELPNHHPEPPSPRSGDFAVAIAKLLFLAAYQRDRYHQLAAGPDQELAAIAAKAAKESTYHLDYATLWTLRLGDGTEESHRRMQRAVDEIWPYTYELFDGNDLRPLAGHGGAGARQATLTRPADGGGSTAAAGSGATPSTSPACSPRCRWCTGPPGQ